MFSASTPTCHITWAALEYLRAGYQIYNSDNARNGVALRYGFWF
ncbi:MAG TPA: hypothetical protein VIM99_15965 [Blastocatellia bacterium]